MRHNTHAFTLIELSIVLVILGLIVGGIIGGQAMVASAKLQQQVKQFSGFLTSYNAFKMQYDAIPGDMRDATDYWPSGTTSGNGDGFIQKGGGSPLYCQDANSFGGENREFFKQLELADLITKRSTSSYPTAIDETKGMVACSREGIWQQQWNGHTVSASAMLALTIGDPKNTTAWGLKDDLGIFLPRQAHSIDEKMDDGEPKEGVIVSWKGRGNTSNCLTNSTLTAQYALGGSQTSCQLGYILEK